ncbi:hypothetical protein [Microbispora sp. NPDC049633]|uniref:hypothetical protein n=1 Tax=Microbispora sp. NPDC049633 TaxID=3154355 RepID=UPI0034216006
MVLTRPPPSLIAVAPGSRSPMRASMSPVSNAWLKSLTIRACRATGAAGTCVPRMRRRAEDASWRQAAGVRPTMPATSAKE